MFVGFLLEVVLFAVEGIVETKSAIRIAVVPVLVVVALMIAPMIGLESLGQSIAGRILEGIQFLSSGSGTWGDRLDQNRWTWELLDRGHWLLGVGTDFVAYTGYVVDLGLTQTLISIGVLGLTVFALAMVICLLGAIHGFRAAVGNEFFFGAVICAGASAMIVQRLVYQHWIYPESAGLLAFGVAATLVVPYLEDEPGDAEVDEPEEAGDWDEGIPGRDAGRAESED